MAQALNVWDDVFLKMFEAEARDVARSAVVDADWLQATRQVERELCDHVGGYVLCPTSICRRARRCAHALVVCADIVDFEVIEAEKLRRIEAVYAQMQMIRRDAAKG